MNDPNADLGNDANINLKGGGGGKGIFLAVGGVLVLVIAYMGWSAKKNDDMRKLHASFMQEMQELEKNEINGKFWGCMLGPGIDPAMIQDNLALGGRIEQAFSADPKNYPQKVRE